MLTAILFAAMSATLSVPADSIARPADPVIAARKFKPQIFTEEFTGGSNEGGWSWDGGFPSIPQKGGNPKWYLRTHNDDTYAPQVATAFGIDSEFTGNYRAKGVFRMGADFLTERVDFSAADRPISLLLTSDPGTPDDPSDDCTIYTVGTAFAPVPGEGWRHYEFTLDRPDSHVLPGNWQVLDCNEPTPDAAWNRVFEDVDQAKFFYGDPTYFFEFQNFTVGVDNIFWLKFSEDLP
ncbi:MAG TPA: hypothetical protein VFV19_12450 [Candidatus Polarisedimenticolaceae bacterium]|nr:hypothetical protein [Candidatus Polarisedimenticolaceae bacterium]